MYAVHIRCWPAVQTYELCMKSVDSRLRTDPYTRAENLAGIKFALWLSFEHALILKLWYYRLSKSVRTIRISVTLFFYKFVLFAHVLLFLIVPQSTTLQYLGLFQEFQAIGLQRMLSRGRNGHHNSKEPWGANEERETAEKASSRTGIYGRHHWSSHSRTTHSRRE